MKIEINGWSSLENCEYPICETDEAAPVYILWEGNEIEAWYRNPEMNVCFFESDTGAELEGVFWKDRVESDL